MARTSSLRLAFGPLFYILYAHRKNSSNQVAMLNDLFSALCDEDNTAEGMPLSVYEKNRVSMFTAGKAVIPRLVAEKAAAADPLSVRSNMHSFLRKHVREDALATVVLSFKWLLGKDASVSDGTLVGAGEKSEWLSASRIEPEAFIADMFRYALLETDNRSGEATVSSLREKLPAFRPKELSSLTLSTGGYETGIARKELEKTLKDESFDGTFSELEIPDATDLGDGGTLKAYVLSMQDGAFAYEDLTEFLRLNLGVYVFSRNEIARFENEQKSHMVMHKAVRELESLPGHEHNARESLGGMLVYSFVEHDKNAPKLFSYAELARRPGNDSCLGSTCGAHLMVTRRKDNTVALRAILCLAAIRDTLAECAAELSLRLPAAAETVTKRRLLDSGIMRQQFSNDEIDALRNLIIPKRGRRDMDQGYGIFLGFSVSGLYGDGMSGDPRKAAEEKARKAVMESIGTLAAAARRALGPGRPIYLYFLPFENAGEDSEAIMREVLL